MLKKIHLLRIFNSYLRRLIMILNMSQIMPMMLNHKYMDQISLLLLIEILTTQTYALSNVIFVLFPKAGVMMT